MDIRQAILKAADFIEHNQDRYNFFSNSKPDCGTQGCMLGWIGSFLEVPRSHNYTAAVCKALGLPDNDQHHPFMVRLMGLCQPLGIYAINNRTEVPQALRLYADKYHPAPVKLPDWNALAAEPLPASERVSA